MIIKAMGRRQVVRQLVLVQPSRRFESFRPSQKNKVIWLTLFFFVLNVKAGTIGVFVNGVERGITITENDTVQSFVDKLNNIGVNASYNEKTGLFSMDIDANAINDIDNTGIVDAFHLEGVNEGYESNSLNTYSDRGGLYTSFQYIQKLKELNLIRSMSRSGNCLDNAPIESFFGHLKDEMDYKDCKSLEETRDKIDEYIYYYNNRRY